MRRVKIATFLPHVGVFGGVRRFIELGNAWVAMGHNVTLYHPGGFDISEFALAVPQLSIGSVLGTRAIVRWISVDLGDNELGKIDYLGYGAQHSISQYFPGLPLDLAAGFFAQKIDLGKDLIKTDAFLVNVTGSKRYGLLEPYVGVGYDTFNMDVKYQSTTTPGNGPGPAG